MNKQSAKFTKRTSSRRTCIRHRAYQHNISTKAVDNKKAQLKIQEMSFMLLALVLFFILVALFWLSYQYRQIHQSATQLEEKSAILALNKLAESPELTCGPLCVDSDKLMAVKVDKEYPNFWGFTSLEVRKIYPENNSDINCVIGKYPDCGIFSIFNKNKQETKTSTFVALCRWEKDENGISKKCELAKLLVGAEVK